MALPIENSKILIIDDEPSNVLALSAVLKSRGYVPVPAYHTQECFDKLHQDQDIKLILMDMMMPDIDGYQATASLKQHPSTKHLPIIAVTAQAMPYDKEKCLLAGVDDYISKPVDLEELFRLIRKHLVR